MTAIANSTAFHNTLSVQKSYAEYLQQVNRLTQCAWHIAYTALWNTQLFTAEETVAAKAFISSFIQQQHRLQFDNFVQRVLLARQYINSHPGTYIPVPTSWFHPENKKGFAGTQRWLQAVEQARQASPGYKQALKDFAEAVWQTTETDTPSCFHYWRSFFIQQKANGLLNLYLSTLANYSMSGG